MKDLKSLAALDGPIGDAAADVLEGKKPREVTVADIRELEAAGEG